MLKKSKFNFNIGDMFSSWQVVECVEPKKYKYLCRCSCGNERVFYKYNLLRNAYSTCKKCGNKQLKNIRDIKTYWNYELNGCIFTSTKDFSMEYPYWFICDNGHNFKSTLKDFSLDKCLSCKCNIKSDKYRVEMLEYAYKFFSTIYNNVEKTSDVVYVHGAKLVLSFIESDRFISYRNYYCSEEELLDHAMSLKKEELAATSKGYKFIQLEVTNSFEKNVDKISEIMISLMHS